MAMQPPTQPTPIPPATMPLISPPALLQAYLSQSPPLRPSNRTPHSTRPINLNVGSLTHCNGSSLIKIGESTIVCGIRAEILPVSEIPHFRASENARQETTAQGDGADEEDVYEAVTLNNLLVPNLELNTNSHPSFSANSPPSATAQSLSQRLLSLLHSTRLVRASTLEIRHTSTAVSLLDPDDEAYIPPETNVLKAYWVLYIDCVALSYGGESSMFDAAVMAIVAALRDVRLPAARWDEDAKRVVCDAKYEKATRLSMRGLPCSLGFGVFVPDGKLLHSRGEVNGAAQTGSRGETGMEATILVDMDGFEDDVCEERGNVVVDCEAGKLRVWRIEKIGGQGKLGVEDVKEVLRKAETRWREWVGVLEAALRSSR